jgi:mRNA interferase MazF
VRQPAIEPGQVWFVDLAPVRGREHGKNRPALVVSSHLHLELTAGDLVSVAPLTNVERPGWSHRGRVASARSWVVTEQVRTLSADRFRQYAPELALSAGELAEVRRILARLLIGERT